MITKDTLLLYLHVKPVGFLSDVACFKLSSVVAMALYQVK